MKVLITGGGGFLGSHLAEALLAKGQAVTLYDLTFPPRWTPATSPSQPGKLSLAQGDVRDADRLEQVLRAQRSTHLIHLATLLTPECEADPARAIDVNCRGSAAVFEAAGRLGITRVLYGSSVAVFSDDPALPWGDERPYGPASFYGLTKVFSEQLARKFSQRFPQTVYLGLRFGWIYGPGRDRGWREVQAVIESVARGDRQVAYPDYPAPLDWTYITDAVAAVITVLDSPRPGVPAYNVSGDCRTIQEAVRYLQQRFPDMRAEPYSAELPPVGWRFRSEHIRSEAGFQRRFNLEQGLEQFLAQYTASFNDRQSKKEGQ